MNFRVTIQQQQKEGSKMLQQRYLVVNIINVLIVLVSYVTKSKTNIIINTFLYINYILLHHVVSPGLFQSWCLKLYFEPYGTGTFDPILSTRYWEILNKNRHMVFLFFNLCKNSKEFFNSVSVKPNREIGWVKALVPVRLSRLW